MVNRRSDMVRAREDLATTGKITEVINLFDFCWGSPYGVWVNSPSKRPDEGIMAEAQPAEALPNPRRRRSSRRRLPPKTAEV